MARMFHRAIPDETGEFSYSIFGDSVTKEGEHPTGTVTFNFSPGKFIETTTTKKNPQIGNLNPDYVRFLQRESPYNVDEPLRDYTMAHMAHTEDARAYRELPKEADRNTVREALQTYRRSGIDVARARSRITKQYWAHPDRLFYEQEPQLSVSFAAVHSSLRHTLPLVAADAMRKTKVSEIEADASLSKHSSALVKNAMDRGLPIKTPRINPRAEVTNDMDFDDYNRTTVPGVIRATAASPNYTEVTPDEKKTNKTFLRRMLETARADIQSEEPTITRRVNPSQFSQPKLPGMENY